MVSVLNCKLNFDLEILESSFLLGITDSCQFRIQCNGCLFRRVSPQCNMISSKYCTSRTANRNRNKTLETVQHCRAILL